MAVVGVPDVPVLKLVHVDVQAVRVHVHVGNEEMSDKPSDPPSLEYSQDCILFGTSKFSSPSHQLAFFILKKASTLSQPADWQAMKLPNDDFQQS